MAVAYRVKCVENIIQTAEEYTGIGVAICVYDSSFYLPDSGLTDDELL